MGFLSMTSGIFSLSGLAVFKTYDILNWNITVFIIFISERLVNMVEYQ